MSRPSVVVVSGSVDTRFRVAEALDTGRVIVTHLRNLRQLERMLRVHQPGTVVIDEELLPRTVRTRPLARSLAACPRVLVLQGESPSAVRLPWPRLSPQGVRDQLEGIVVPQQPENSQIRLYDRRP